MAPSGAVGLAFIMSLWLKPMLRNAPRVSEPRQVAGAKIGIWSGQALPPMLDRFADRS
jgi:hypothetical protein